MSLLFVGIGGAIGAILRYLLSQLPFQHYFPLKTLLINLLGSLAIGYLSAKFQQAHWFEGDQWLLITGVCGGFTTFSTFSLESLQLIQNGNTPLAIFYMIVSLIGGLCCVGIGFFLGNSSF